MDVDDYQQFREFLEKVSGINLGENKHYLINSRLNSVMREFSIGSLGELINRLNRGIASTLRQKTVDAMTTNETQWFRDIYPFKIFREQVLKELGSRGGGKLRIWSAACSSGQEPYSLSISVDEFRQKNPGRLSREVEIVGTDLSSSMLTVAQEGVYDSMALSRGLSEERKQR
ncbi:MAG: chemotaxis protein, partial [Gammaproteobacteria bacterium]|nr:chemotaxis protein [Gammaproteobacteria bacterium]